jgi:hypothetical protein
MVVLAWLRPSTSTSVPSRRNLVQSGDRGDVPEVRARQVDDLIKDFLEVKGGDELVGGAEEHLAGHLVAAGTAAGVDCAADVQEVADLGATPAMTEHDCGARPGVARPWKGHPVQRHGQCAA